MGQIIYDKKYLLSGYDFGAKSPYLVLDDIFKAPVERIVFPIINNQFTLNRESEKYCIGSYNLNLNKYYTCPNRAKIENQYTLCNACKRRQGFNPAFYNADFISLQQRKRNNEAHIVYLANFGHGITKIGIAYHKRIMTRLLEQGARTALILKHCQNAYEAREIEEFAHCVLEIPEVVSKKKKRYLINQKFDIDSSKKEMMDIKEKINKKNECVIENNQVQDFSKQYLQNSILDFPIIDLTGQSNFISGNGLGMIGDNLIVCHEGEQFMVSIKPWIAHLVVLNDQLIKNQYLDKTIQNKLF